CPLEVCTLSLVCRSWHVVSKDDKIAALLGERQAIGFGRCKTWQELKALRINLAARNFFCRRWSSHFDFDGRQGRDTFMLCAGFVSAEKLLVSLDRTVYYFH